MSPQTPTIRLVAVDLDGTLLDDSKRVSPPTAEALRALGGRGVKVVIASARPPRSVRHIYQQLGLETWQINYNGALIWDEPRHAGVFHRPIDALTARRIIDAARDLFEEVLVSCEIMDRWFTDRFDPAHTTETGKLFKPDVIAPIEEICRTSVTKVMMLGAPRMILRLEEFVLEKFARDVSVVRTDDDLLQIMDSRVSKAVALQLTAKHYGIAMEDVMAVGDAPNDVGMLRCAGVGVAMDNAHALVKDAAQWIAPSNNDHGVLAALRRYGLCE